VSCVVLSTLRPVRLGPCHVCGGGKSQRISGMCPVSEVFCELWGLLLMCAVQLGQMLFCLFCFCYRTKVSVSELSEHKSDSTVYVCLCLCK